MAPTEDAPEADKPAEAAPESSEAQQAPSTSTPMSDAEEKALQKIQKLIQEKHLREASEGLQQMLKSRPGDAMLLHNLGVVHMDLGELAKAEEVFWDAFEKNQKDGKGSLATMYGLATVMTEQGETPKLLQAEALLRHILETTCSQPDMAPDTYRSFVGLANNCAKQKKWDVAVQAWESAVALGTSMFGEDSELVASHKAALTRASKLARWQARLKIVMWTLAIVIPVLIAWYMYSGDTTSPAVQLESHLTPDFVEPEPLEVEASGTSPAG